MLLFIFKFSYYKILQTIFSAHMLTDDVHITQMAKDAEFFGSDGVIVTGKSTGLETSIEELKGQLTIRLFGEHILNKLLCTVHTP